MKLPSSLLGVLMSEEFSTVDITRLTPKGKILELADGDARPGKMCEKSPGFIHQGEVEDIAEKLGLSLEELKENFLREIRAYNTTLHKPKHEPDEIRLGSKRTGAIHRAPHGKCIFLDKGSPGEHKCMLGEKMPLHCRMSTKKQYSHKLHVWYLLNHAVNPNDPRSLREWAIYLKTHPTIPGGRLEDIVPDPGRLRSILESEDYQIEIEDMKNNI